MRKRQVRLWLWPVSIGKLLCILSDPRSPWWILGANRKAAVGLGRLERLDMARACGFMIWLQKVHVPQSWVPAQAMCIMMYNTSNMCIYIDKKSQLAFFSALGKSNLSENKESRGTQKPRCEQIFVNDCQRTACPRSSGRPTMLLLLLRGLCLFAMAPS